MDNQELIKLKNWFLQIRRTLPWRENITPYRVWISEIMLQQTRVSTVIPYFMRWMEEFPNIKVLENAPLEKIIKLWEGLGYYSRARSIHKTAQILIAKYKGVFPQTIQELEKLPGIGPYTSRALLCFTCKVPVAPVDSNVMRVLARFYSISLDIGTIEAKKKIQSLADQLFIDENTPPILGEALIELGALICRRIPLCNSCPIRSGCNSLQQNAVTHFPITKRKMFITTLYRTVFIIIHKRSILIRKERDKKIMSDLWQFPYVEGIIKLEEVTEIIGKQFSLYVISSSLLDLEQQSFTRYRVSLRPILCEIDKKYSVQLYDWVALENARNLAFCSGHRRILQKIFSKSDKN